MKIISRFAVVALAIFAAPAFAQEAPKPSAEHELLKQMAGEWDANMKCYMEPGKPAVESKGSYSAKMDVGGLFIFSDFKGELAGMTFQGRGITGYDLHQKKFTGVWVDSMSSSLYQTVGEFDKAGKVYTENMEGPGPDGAKMKFRSVTEVKDKDNMTFKMYMPGPDGKEGLMMEMAYTRKK